MNVDSIVNGLENFYEVWSDGVSGDIIDVQKKLSDLETLSIQTAKKIINEPHMLRQECSKSLAEKEIGYFEQTGLKCKMVHVGPKLLNQYTEKEIENFLCEVPGGIDSAFIKEVETGTYALFSKDGRVEIDYDEIGFYFYLSCLRYLAVKGRIKT